jgi:hypothetical protein
MKNDAWTTTNANLASKVGQTFRNGAYRLLAIDADGLDVEWTATGKRARVWRTLVEKTAARLERGETIRERTISYTVIVEFFVREALAETVVVVACAQEKAPVAKAPAKDLYASSTFRMARRFAESVGAWAILSAKHGLVSPDAELENYDLALPKLPAAERRTWAAKVAEQIDASVSAVRVRFVVVAGAAYRAAFEALQVFGSSAIQWDCPVAGFEIGEMRGWLAAQVRA